MVRGQGCAVSPVTAVQVKGVPSYLRVVQLPIPGPPSIATFIDTYLG